MTNAEFEDARWELRLTQRQIAERLGVTTETVSRWKRKGLPLIADLALRGLLCERKHAERT